MRRQALLDLGRPWPRATVLRHAVVHLEIAVEAPHRGERPRRGAPREALPLQLAEKPAQTEPIHRGPGPVRRRSSGRRTRRTRRGPGDRPLTVWGEWSRSLARWMRNSATQTSSDRDCADRTLFTASCIQCSHELRPAPRRPSARASALLLASFFTFAGERIEQAEVRVHRLEVLRIGLAQVAVAARRASSSAAAPRAARRRARRARLMPARRPVPSDSM